MGVQPLPAHGLRPLPARRSHVRAPAAVPELMDAVPHVDAAVNAVSALISHAALGYEPVALPCSLMKCGDVVHRSTLDPVLRKEVTGLDWRGLALLSAAATYLFLTPGVLPGFVDYYVLGPIQRAIYAKAYGKEDITLGKRLGTGGFGAVFKADLTQEDGSKTPVIVKKAKEFGEAEVWMNERMMRAGPSYVAEFVTAFTDDLPKVGSPLDNAVWLVWAYEGDFTLDSLMQKREFPYNMEPLLLGRELRLPRGARRREVSVKLLMAQLLEAVQACHATGIIHRDIKPQNAIWSDRDRKLKLIDLGAAADLRIGINYVPNEFLLDPRYAPPQQYIMSTQTPRPPPKPVAALLSPVLWRMETPDRFDMYSCGVVLLQMAFPNLRSDNNLIAFNRKLEAAKYDLQAWRRSEEKRGLGKEMADGFELLDLDGGKGWDLLCKLMAYKPSDRLSAAAALAHPWFASLHAGAAAVDRVNAVNNAVSEALTSATRAVGSALGASEFVDSDMVNRDGGLTEAQLVQELGLTESQSPAPPREGSQTIAWFQERESLLQKKRRAKSGASGASAGAGMGRAAVNGSGKVARGGLRALAPGSLDEVKRRAANGNGNGKAAAANGYGKAAASNGNGNGNGNGKRGSFLGLGKIQFPGLPGSRNQDSEDEEEQEGGSESGAKLAAKFDLFSLIRSNK